jgi:hypothetical protein
VNRLGLALALAALAAAPAAHAQYRESPRLGSFELGAGKYYPNIDSAFAAPGPYQTIFGTAQGWMFRAGISRALIMRPGALEVGFKTGYFRDSGNELVKTLGGAITPVPSSGKTTFNIIPTSVTLTYRFDLLADNFHVPFAPYGRVALERYNWWVTKAVGGNAKMGGTNGWSATGGMALQLDFFDPGLARELDQETGINHTYVFFDVTKSFVDDFGASKSWDLSDKKVTYGFGMLFVF